MAGASRVRPPSSYDRIYSVVRRIPRGTVATYGQIAALAGLPRAPRVAGYALYALPAGSPLPWHRVVGAGGRLSLARLDPSTALTQRMKLEAEGVAFGPAGRVRMDRHQWSPRARPGLAPKRGKVARRTTLRRPPGTRTRPRG